MFTKALGSRQQLNWSPAPPKGRHQVSTGRSWSHPSVAIPAAPVVDIGSVPTPADALIQHLHERCTSTEQPFCWSTSVTATDGDSQAPSGTVTISPGANGTCAGRPSTFYLAQQLGLSQARSNGSAAESPLRIEQHTSLQHLQQQQQRPQQQPVLGDGAPTLEVVEVDERCAETHPGSICCTTTAVEKDATSHSCSVTLRTTVKLTDSRLHVEAAELEELAWLAAREAASEAMSALNRQGSLPAGREERHRFVCNMLANGTIRDAKRMENGFGHVSYLVTLEDKATGKKLRAAFKPRVEGDCEGWHRVPIEVAAYQLSLLLGMDCVPPAVLRPDCHVDWTHYPAGGAFIYWCGAARQLNTVPMAEWSVPGPVLLSDTRILDVLIQNSDRHAGHFLYAEHWADGDYAPAPQGRGGGGGSGGSGSVWRGRLSPVLIDHAAGFRQDAFVCLDHENAFLTGPTRRISARTYLRLRFLDAPTLRAALHGIVTDEEIAALLSRRDAVLSFFDSLVTEQGYNNVVLEA
ncbi:hypothetical protein PLESTB_001771000 [Pleodorina starrii]|uniref:PI3K/PI4K catalytic domain-containing protein n=1 Tax=Pleodorina starrii TaxID=330485 RepID=A0A9W6C188_9CHLO|nr:hypothetical protein PLESTM_000827300 [Pleodorina starrii]GLC61570.1 hypothetical protein PLESTB_001771000 [Pleodorina starrii]GLC76966.1 hypothetical protein PLESTF_001861500 [Pleodorina starrii]